MNNITSVYSELGKLNDDWISKFEKNDKLYHDLYKDNVYYTNIDFIYINKENEIEKIKQESFLMSVENCITRDELIGLLKRNSIDNNKRYSIMSILKYNVTLEDNDIKNFLLSSNSSDYNEYFLTINKHIDTIKFEKTINMFQDLNNIYFIFYEKPKPLNNSGNVITQKVYLTSSYKKKTIKK
jgi:hypothetical protein